MFRKEKIKEILINYKTELQINSLRKNKNILDKSSKNNNKSNTLKEPINYAKKRSRRRDN